MSTNRNTLLFAAVCAFATPLLAQDAPPAPRILQIVEETVKPGKGPAHEKNESAWVTAYATANNNAHYFAMTPMTGGRNTLYIGGFQSFAEIDKAYTAVGKVPGLSAKIAALGEKDGEYLDNVRVTLARFLPGITVGGVPDFSKVHGYRITTYRVRIGHTEEFMEWRRMVKAAMEKGGLGQERRGTFVVTEGVTVPTYIVFRPFTSITEFDGDSAVAARISAQYTPDELEKGRKLQESALLTRETVTYTVSPQQSYVPVSFAEADPFWKTNPVIVAAAAKKSSVMQAGAKAKKTTP